MLPGEILEGDASTGNRPSLPPRCFAAAEGSAPSAAFSKI